MTFLSPRRWGRRAASGLTALAAAGLLVVAVPAAAPAESAAANSAPANSAPAKSAPVTDAPASADATAEVPSAPLPVRRAYVQGDSVMVGALAEVTGTLRADGWAGTITGFTGLHTYAAIPLFRQVRSTMGSVAVMELGANDCCDGGSFGRVIDRVMRVLAGLHVIWLTNPAYKPGMAGMNQALLAAARRWPELAVADWAGALAAHPGDVYPDGVHLRPQGSTLLAGFIRQQLDAWFDGPERTYVAGFGAAAPQTGGGWLPPAGSVVGAAPDGNAPTGGFWAADSRGGVYSFGGAGFYGSASAEKLTAPMVGLASTPDGGGYWLAGADGGVFSFGDAGFYGSAASEKLTAPIVGLAATPDGRGYWLVGADGGVFSFGDASFFGSAGSEHLAAPVVGMATAPDGRGYWLAAADGGVFSFGAAPFLGSPSAAHLAAPVVGISPTFDGRGYWLDGSDGGVFSYGDAHFAGAGQEWVGPYQVKAAFAGLVPSNAGGYWLVGEAPALADVPVPTAPPATSPSTTGPSRIRGTARAPSHRAAGRPSALSAPPVGPARRGTGATGMSAGIGALLVVLALMFTIGQARRRQFQRRRASRRHPPPAEAPQPLNRR